jgi:hypothetical protein
MLVEMLIGLVMLAILATAVVVIVRSAGGNATRAATALLADRSVRTFETFVQHELRDASAVDVVLLGPARIGLSRSIGEALPCADSGGIVLLRNTTWTGTRAPQGSRDDVWLLVDPVAGTWVRLAIDSVGTGSCPAGGAPATRLNVAPHVGIAAAVRVVEPVEVSAYRSGSTDWFGLTPADHSSSVQPFAGPLLPGATQFNWFSDHLDIVVSPLAMATTSVTVPFGPPL